MQAMVSGALRTVRRKGQPLLQVVQRQLVGLRVLARQSPQQTLEPVPARQQRKQRQMHKM